MSEAKEPVCYTKDIADAVKFIENEFAKVSGVLKVSINIHRPNKAVVYVVIDNEAVKSCEDDMIFPREVRLRFVKETTNETKFPRIWLEERAAEVKCQKHLAKLYPNVKFEYSVFIKRQNSISIV